MLAERVLWLEGLLPSWYRGVTILIFLLSLWSVREYQRALHGEYFLISDLYLMMVLASFWWQWRGVLAAALASVGVIAAHWWINPDARMTEEIIQWLLLVLCGFLVSLLSAGLRRNMGRLAASEQQWKALVESLPDGVVLFDRDANVLSSNNGGSGDKAMADLSREAAAQRLRQAAERMASTGEAFSELRDQGSAAAPLFVEHRYLAIAGGGAAGRFICISTDVSTAIETERRIHALLAVTSKSGMENLIVGLGELAAILDLRVILVARYLPEGGRLRTVAMLVDGVPSEREFVSEDLPVAAAGSGGLGIISQGLRGRIPEESPFADFEAEGYLCLPLRSGDGSLQGVMAGFSRGPVLDEVRAANLFVLFGRIIGMEMEQDAITNKLKESQKNFVNLAKNIDEVYWVWDVAEQAVVFVNAAFRKVWGRSGRNLLRDHRTLLDAVRPADRKEVGRLFSDGSNGSGVDIRTRILRPGGDFRWAWIRGYPVKDASGRVTQVIGCASDVTQHQEMLDRVVCSEERLRSIIDNISTGFLLVDAEGRVTLFNDAAVTHLGLEDGLSLLGRRLEEVLPGVTDLLPRMKAGDQQSITRAVSGGGIRTLGLTATRENSGGWILIFRDLSRQIELEDRRRRAEELTVFGAVAARLSHDIKNSLMTILAGLHVVRLNVADGDTRQVIDDIAREINIVNGTAASILDSVRVRPLYPRAVPLGMFVEEATRLFHSLADGRDVSLHVRLGEEASVVIDETEFRKVIGNLVINAIEAVERGGAVEVGQRLMLDEEVARSFPGFGGRVSEVTVSDNGPGIPKDILPKVLRPFYTTKPKGSGLGLPIALEVVESLGGLLSLQTEPGRGTTARIFLPTDHDEPCYEVVESVKCEGCPVMASSSGFCCWAVMGKTTRIATGAWPEKCQKCRYYLARNLMPYWGHDPGRYEEGTLCRV